MVIKKTIPPEIFYPETDDIPPTPDGYYQSKHTRDLITMLALFFAQRGERLVNGEYRPMEMRADSDRGVWGYSATLNLEFHWVDGSLRVYDPVGGRWLQTSGELEVARVAVESRAENERLAREAAESWMAELRRLRGE